MFTTIQTKTQETKLQKGHPFGKRVLKFHKFQVASINTNYLNSISNQAKRQLLDMDWKVEGPAWGERVKGTPFKVYKGQVYLCVQPMRTLEVSWYDVDNQRVIPAEEIISWLKESKSKKQKDAGLKEIKFRNYALRNVLKINGKKPFEYFNMV